MPLEAYTKVDESLNETRKELTRHLYANIVAGAGIFNPA